MRYGVNQKAYVNRDWENALQAAQILLEKNDVNGAQNILKPFFGFTQYKNIADEILQDYIHYKSFRSAYEKQDLKTMYAIANKHKHFKNSTIFLEAEKQWNKIINSAVNQLSVSQNINKSDFVSVLEPYLGVADKAPIIQLLIKDTAAFLNFKQAIAKKEYANVFTIADKYPMLKQSGEYISVVQFGEALLENSEIAVKKGDIEKARKLLLLLDRFPSYQANYLSLDGRIGRVAQMCHFVETKQYKEFFELCKRYPYLEDTEQYPKLLEIAKTHMNG